VLKNFRSYSLDLYAVLPTPPGIETLVNVSNIIRRVNPEHQHLNLYLCENFKSLKNFFVTHTSDANSFRFR